MTIVEALGSLGSSVIVNLSGPTHQLLTLCVYVLHNGMMEKLTASHHLVTTTSQSY